MLRAAKACLTKYNKKADSNSSSGAIADILHPSNFHFYSKATVLFANAEKEALLKAVTAHMMHAQIHVV